MTDWERREREKAKERRKSFTGLFGFISLVVTGAFAWSIAPALRSLVEENSGISFPGAWPYWYGRALIALIIFVLLFAVAMMLIAVLAGSPTDPRDVRTSPKRRRRRR
jgi:uncharacterized BrkB/YihY/UPF0761 family membrane protein